MHSKESSHVTVTSTLAKNWIKHFHHKLEDICLSASATGFHIKSFSEMLVDDQGQVLRSLQTDLECDPRDFESFHIPQSLSVVLSLKDFKIILQLAESLNLPFTMYLKECGE